jgi:hypothetical protein
MKTGIKSLASLLAASAIIMTSGCFAPVNLTYDDARMLNKNEMKVQAGFSSYYGPKLNLSDDELLRLAVHYTNNYNIQAAYGLSQKINVGLRYEYMDVKEQHIQILTKSFDLQNTTLNYVELSGKVRLIEDDLALGLPVSMYFWEGVTFAMFDPRLYYTFHVNDKVEFTFVPKAHILFADKIGVSPAFSFGMGISNNLNRWAFRPEIGYDGWISFGFGVDYKFNGARNKAAK